MQNTSSKLVRFYLLLPKNYIQDAIESLHFTNREIRRKYDKCKSVSDKISFIVKSNTLIIQFNTYLYDQYKCSAKFSEEDSFETVLSSINKDNCISNTLFLLHLCFRNDNRKINKKQLLLLLESEQFSNIINNTWNRILLKDQSHVNDENNSTDGTHRKINIQNVMEEKTMNKYLGYIQKYQNFYNFFPQYIIRKGNVERIRAEELFPNSGGVNLHYERIHDDANSFLEELNRKYALFAIDLENEIKDNVYGGILNSRYQKKVALSNIGDLGHTIADINQENIYKIVEPEDEITQPNFIENRINIRGYAEENDKVLLKYAEKLYGPFTCSERKLDGQKQILCEVGKNNSYLCKYYKYSSDDIIHFTWYDDDNRETATIEAYCTANQTSYTEDMITDAILISKFNEKINLEMMRKDPKEFSRLLSLSPYLSKGVPDEIKEQRIRKIKSIFSATKEFEKDQAEVTQAIINSIKGNEHLFEKAICESDIYKELRNDMKTLETDKNRLEKERDNLSDNYERLKHENEDSESAKIIKTQNEINESGKKLDDLKNKVTAYEKTYNAYSELDGIEEQITKRKGVKEEYNKEINDLKSKKNTLQLEVDTAISNAKNGAEIAFNPYISSKLLEKAAEWQANKNDKDYEIIVNNLEKEASATERLNKDKLIDYLVGYVNSKRKYSHNDIANMYICLVQGFLTVFAGEPGTGKTSICNILADSLGLSQLNNCDSDFNTNYCEKYNRYIPVAVERGWSSKRDLIGYFNPITKKYNSSNGKIYNGLRILDIEKDNSKLPYIILLDEANLSPMEYYWSDFMRPADDFGSADNVNVKRTINIGTENEIYIPKTLKFLATINNDQTVTPLSPRLIDRAWIIKLPKQKEKITSDGSKTKEKSKLILWEDLCETFTLGEDKMELDTVADEVYECFEENNINVSNRIYLDIKKYVCTAQNIMQVENGSTPAQAALDFAIVQKLLPKIDGEYSKLKSLFDKLNKICEDNSLTKTSKALDKMKISSESNMGYCQFM